MNGRSDYSMVTSPTDMLVIGLQALNKGDDVLTMKTIGVEGSFHYLELKEILYNTQMCNCLRTNNARRGVCNVEKCH